MNNYITCKIECPEELREVLVAELAEAGFEGFLETETGMEAYLPESEFSSQVLYETLERYGIPAENCHTEVVAQQNWNALWESSFAPVEIDGKIRIRAPFHAADSSFPYEIIIQPKTSFGTGHHETTATIMGLMLETSFEGKSVFDYGSGTGILAILAHRLGAASIFANDIDTWAAENIFENTALNGNVPVTFEMGNLQVASGKMFDIILANINKNILMQSFGSLSEMICRGGQLFISGFYEKDLEDLQEQASKNHFNLKLKRVENGWCAAIFTFNG